MGTRITSDASDITFRVFVNTIQEQPDYASESLAIARGEREAKTHATVVVARYRGTGKPKVIASWENGRRQ